MKNPIKSFFDEKKLKKVASELGVLAKKDVLTFGKYATLRVKDVMKKDPLYLCWIHDNTSHKLQTAVILEAREKGAKQRLKQQADRDDRYVAERRERSEDRTSSIGGWKGLIYSQEKRRSKYYDMDPDECYDLYGPDPVDCGPFW